MSLTIRQFFISCLLLSFCSVLKAQSDASSLNSIKAGVASAQTIEALQDIQEQIKKIPNDSIAHKIKVLRLSYEQAKQIGSEEFILKIGNNLFSELFYQDSLSACLTYATELYGIAQRNPIKESAHLMNSLGNLYSEFGDHNSALKYFLESAEYFKKCGEIEYQTYPLGNIGETIYFDMGEFEKALYYYERAMAYSKQLSEPKRSYNLLYDHYRIGDTYLEMEKLDSAKIQFNKAIANAKTYLKESNRSQTNLLALCYGKMGKYYIVNKQYELGSTYIDSSLQVIKDFPLTSNTTAIYIDIINHLIELNNLPKASKYIHKIKDQINTKERVSLGLYLVETMASFYEKLQDFEKAFINQKKADSLQSIIYTQEHTRYAEFANTKFMLAQQEAEAAQKIALLEEQRKNDQLKLDRQRLNSFAAFMAMLLLLLLILGLSSVLLWNNTRKKKYNKLLEEEVALKTQKLASINNDLIQTNYELQQFNHIVSHDLKEPLRTIVSFSNLAARKIEPNSEIGVYLDYIIKGGTQLHTLIRDVLEFQNTSKTIKNLEEVNVNETVEEIKMSLTRFLEDKNGTVTYRNLPTISSHRTPMFIIFKNLVENGLKYNQSKHPEVIITHATENNEHWFFIKDNGIGIEPMYREKVFEMFSRLHNRDVYNGTGLGLALVQKLAYQMDGEIVITESSPKQGTTFLLKLPIKDTGKLAENAVKPVNYKLN